MDSPCFVVDNMINKGLISFQGCDGNLTRNLEQVQQKDFICQGILHNVIIHWGMVRIMVNYSSMGFIHQGLSELEKKYFY